MNVVRRYSWIAAVVAMVAFGAGLALFAYAGSFTRYWADDYCYSAWVQHYGLFGAIADWYQTSGNRLSTLAAVALTELFGPGAIGFVPGGVLLLWVGAWVFALSRIARFAKWGIRPIWWFAASLAMVYFTVLLAPDRLQSVYWRMGTLHYALPLPLLLINLGIIAGALAVNRRGWAWLVAGCGLLAFFAAGLSETAGALQAGLFGLLLAAWVIFRRGDRRGGILFTASLVGTLLMMLIQTQAPANAWRQAAMPPPDNLLLVVPVSLRFAAEFAFYALRGQIVPFAVFVLAVAALALLAVGEETPRISARAAGFGIIGSLVIAYLLIVCTFAPSAYAGLQYPAGRAQMPGHFALMAGLGAAAVFGTILLRRLIPSGKGFAQTVALVILLAACLYPLRALPVVRADISRLSAWSARWDARDAQIRQSAAAGEMVLIVPQVEVVQSLEDIGPDPAHWINACATLYYRVGSITAQPEAVQ